jgi:uncharacterized protein YprB with RNaseH-like and TPR domain
VGGALGTAERLLGGSWRQEGGLSCFIVERQLEPESYHGDASLKAVAARLADASADAAFLMAGPGGQAARPPFVFFDLETTGLSGGAGTFVFLVGCGSFDGDGRFRTRQFVLLRHGDERALLQAVGSELARAGVLVSFNGKSFDAPLIETRYLYHRLEWPAGAVPHLDVLHPARRFWGDERMDGRCSLGALEQQLLGVRRTGDVPGAEAPARYFRFLRTGDAAALAPVLEHNRADLLSLAGLTARLLDLVRIGPAASRTAREALALGRVYARTGHLTRSRDAYERAFACGAGAVRIDAARSLALLCRRTRRHDDAAAFWRELIAVPACPPHLAREANEALAIHHEHRARDLAAARSFALKSLVESGGEGPRTTAWNRAVGHRLARIERKMNRPQLSQLDFHAES